MNNDSSQRNFCLYVCGFPQDTDRNTLKYKFRKYGNIEKLFLENSGKFAKVYYDNKESCDLAIQELNNTALNWQVQYSLPSKALQDKLNLSSSSLPSEASNMASYIDGYDDAEDFSENYDYCNVHGQPLTVLQADTGDLYVNLKDIRKTGFALFGRETFNSVPVDKRQIGKEFELHLLSEAKNYILNNSVAVIKEEDILKTIERCKSKLLAGSSSSDNKHNFGSGRSIASSQRNNFSITTQVHGPSSSTSYSGSQLTPIQRSPKTMPNNFMPSGSHRTAQERSMQRSKSQDRGPRSNQNTGNRKDSEYKFNKGHRNSNRERSEFINGFDASAEKKWPTDQSLNNFQEPKIDVRKPRNYTETNEERKIQRQENVGKLKLEVGSTHDNKTNHSSKSAIKEPKTDVEKSESGAEKIKKEEKKISVQEDFKKLILEVGSTYDVTIVYTEDKENICWVQRKDSAEAVDDLLLQINEKEEDLKTIKPAIGQLVMAQFEGAWSRGKVCSLEPLVVHFIDYGNKSPVDAVKPLPDIFKKLPALAARLKINECQKLSSEVTELVIKVKHEYDDGTYLVTLVELNSSSESDTPPQKSSDLPKEKPVKEKAYFNIPKPLSHLKHGDKIMLIDLEGTKFLVRTKECAQKCKELTEYIKNLDKAALIVTNVKVGQLVLCSKDGLVGLYRAIVTKKEGESVVTVKYVDFPGEDDLSITSLRQVDEYLSKEPSCILLTAEHKGLNVVNEEVMNYVSELCQNKQKFTLISSGDDFDLQFDDGLLLSEKLAELVSPKKPAEIKSLSKQTEEKETSSTPKRKKSTSDKVTYDDMSWVTIEPGSHSFMCYRFKDFNDITMIDSSEEVINYFENITGIEPTDDVPYTPEELEMVIVLYKGPDDDDASWFRATVLSVEDDEYDVSFVDFGNQERVKSHDIRRFPPALKDIPMLGVSCELVGIPKTSVILDTIKEVLTEGDQVDVVVKASSANADHKYQIEIPTIYKLLQAEGLF